MACVPGVRREASHPQLIVVTPSGSIAQGLPTPPARHFRVPFLKSRPRSDNLLATRPQPHWAQAMSALIKFITEDWFFFLPMLLLSLVAAALVVWRWLLNLNAR